MAEKAPYKLTVKLDSARPDAIGQAMRALQDITAEADQSGDVLVTEPPAEVAGLLPSPMLALPAPDDELVIEGSYTVDAD